MIITGISLSICNVTLLAVAGILVLGLVVLYIAAHFIP